MSVLNILSGGAAQGLIASLAPAFRAQTGLDIEGEFGAVGAMAANLRNGTRADLVILKAARAQAAFEGRTSITDHDIALAAELALPHRI